MRRLIVNALNTMLELIALLCLIAGVIVGWGMNGPIGSIIGFLIALVVCVVLLGILFVIMEMNANIAAIRDQLKRVEQNDWGRTSTHPEHNDGVSQREPTPSVKFQPSELAEMSEQEVQQLIDEGSLVSSIRYAKLMGEDPNEVIRKLEERMLVGVERNGQWFLGAPS